MQELVFYASPQVTIASNQFIDVPTILQYDDTPLIEVVRVQPAGYTVQIPIYRSDGTYIAKAVGSRLVATEQGKAAGLSLRFPKDMTVCELDGKTLFEIHRHGAAALSAYAELFTPDGAFVRCAPDIFPKLFVGGAEKALQVGGIVMSNNVIQGFRIGIWVKSDGSVIIGVA